MSFLLDTNICSFHFRKPEGLFSKLIQHSGRVFINSIVLAELYAWAYRRDDPSSLLVSIEAFVTDVPVLMFDNECAEVFGKTRGRLLAKGLSVNSIDLLIASVALKHSFTLVTANTQDFVNVPDLKLENWLPS